MTAAVTTVLAGFHFLEAPRWHDDRLWFSDFYGHRVYSAQADGADLRIEAEVPGQPSGLGWLPDGRLVVVSMTDRRVLRREPDGTLVTHADLTGHAAGHLNDLVVDAAGRVYVGNFGFDLMSGAPIRSAPLHRIDPDGSVSEAAPELWFANGAALTPHGVLLVGETFGNRISAFDVHPDGTLGPRRTWAEFGPLPEPGRPGTPVVAPDGCCLDAEGALWIADATGSRLLRVREGGEITDELRPGSPVFACALGGPDGRTLYACAAPDFAAGARAAATDATLLAIPVTVPGA
jgi:sugar lactone lactonase YvrE